MKPLHVSTGSLKKPIEFSEVSSLPKRKNLWKVLGPGLVTGASDDDPSGIATYAQAGAQFGFATLWTMVLAYPLMTAVQCISGQIGRVTGQGIAGNMRRICPPWVSMVCIGSMVIANTINIAADVAAMGAAVRLVIGGPALVYAVIFGVVSLLLQVFLPYTRYVKILKWLTLVLFSYVVTVFVVHVPWGTALKNTFVPTFSFTSDYFTVLAAIFGTTISPYLLFWQASQEVEEVRSVKEDKPLIKAPGQAPVQLDRIALDTYVGMGFSNVVAYFIILTTAVVLHASGKTDIQTAAEAAEALRPVAGHFAFMLFSLGIIGTGLLALPVLAGSAAYGVSEALRWRSGLEVQPKRARKFYAVLALVMVVGMGLNFVHLDPIKALFWSAVINGIVAPPIMIVMMLIASKREIMQSFTISQKLKYVGWLATIVMILVAALSIAGWIRPS
jgi:NRAMP (natural resistance-associated macrophage protein)-like metal ion transporter